MASMGMAYFDSRGQFHRTPDAATESDLAGLLGKIGEGDSLAPGIAHLLLERRAEIERIFAEHDRMAADSAETLGANVTSIADKRA